DRDLGTIYLDIPLEKIKDDLEIGIEFAFTHYEQRFAIDPEKVGQYDTNSDLYKQYTASTGNTIISDPMADTARKIVGDETNPYLMARKIYDHVVDETTYSHVPHAALPILDYPESKYVFEKRYGDCGAQSMYFSALCRSVGIPARTTGGFQMIGGETGSHFWAEFYLPNYGWLPVDTSVAQLYKYLPEMSKKEQQDYKDFFFGNLDPYRYVIQKDVDLVPSPPPSEKLFFPMVFQLPEVVCRSYTADQIPGLELIEAWKTEVNRVE
ncbi:MAG: transglutaminase-like domain-containing protein, partial [Candidatus Margulisbacteria bacterium]|nr:transglutaminase-like domain-containing protein [Candidatus Margulisiibacteriota bacterium]